jgi:hypothetical protein
MNSFTKELMHHGIQGMHWGERNGPPYPLDAKVSKKIQGTPKTQLTRAKIAMKRLSKHMSQEIKYKDFTKLKDHSQVLKTKYGDCHSQVMYEFEELRKYGIRPKAKFFIEYDPKTNQGGQTHSFVYFNDRATGKTIWLENAWETQKGIHEYPNEHAMIKDVEKKHKAEQTGTRKSFSKVAWGDFKPEDHQAGETLQELVDKCLK